MVLSALGNKKFKRKPLILKTKTVSDFSGGLDLVDNELTLRSRYAKVLDNMVQGSDGSNAVRFGTKYKYSIDTVATGTLIEIVYFSSYIIAFTSTGQIVKITEAGVATLIWSTAIAALLPGAPTGWSSGLTVGCIDTTEFRQELIVQNGTDKPIKITKSGVVDYLQDIPTGSNINTPTGKYVTTVGNYLVVAGISAAPTTLYISNAGTSGTFVGDPAPNDGITLDVATYVAENSSGIIGLAAFRGQLIVIFEGAILVITLGGYEGTTHKPAVQDNIVEHGTINHRTIVTVKNNLILADITGVHTAVKSNYGLINTEAISDLIDPDYIASISTDTALRPMCFSVWDHLGKSITTFVTTEDGVYVGWTMGFSKDNLKAPAWSRLTGWSFTCGCTSARGRVYMGTGTKIYQAGNDTFADEDYSADFMSDAQANWIVGNAYVIGDRVNVDGITYTCLVNHMSSSDFDTDLALLYWELYEGAEINFIWEFPWTSLDNRTVKKGLKYIQADTTGRGSFKLQVFVDNFFIDSLTGDYTPAIEQDFVGGDSAGYGDGDQPFGGGRRLRDERPWGMPAEFKIMKMRIVGSSPLALKIITLSILYNVGTHRR